MKEIAVRSDHNLVNELPYNRNTIISACRCLYLGAVEVNFRQDQEQASIMQAVDDLIPGPVLQATACDQMGAESPLQYTECQLQAAHNEGILLTDLSRKLFFQRHFSANSFIYAGVDPRDKAYVKVVWIGNLRFDQATQ